MDGARAAAGQAPPPDASLAWPAGDAPTAELYVLGFNGPVDDDGMGRPERFVWRFAVVECDGWPPTLLAFRSMPRLMAFTRAVNGREAFTVPTEARRCRLRRPPSPPDLALWVDPEADDFLLRYASVRAQERVIEGLEA